MKRKKRIRKKYEGSLKAYIQKLETEITELKTALQKNRSDLDKRLFEEMMAECNSRENKEKQQIHQMIATMLQERNKKHLFPGR